ncbi:hypothetical protein Dimus_039146 [Dionaea muscipula]
MTDGKALTATSTGNMTTTTNGNDPMVLHHSDSPSLLLVTQLLNGQNYGQWSRSMRIALSAKNKIGFIDGSIKEPNANDTTHPLWQRCNDMVLSWIWQSVEPSIAQSVLYCTTATSAWKDLQDRFSQGNDARIYQLRQEIAQHQQGLLPVSEYYTKLKGLWDELASYFDPITCSCNAAKLLEEREEKEKVMQFLMGLNESYAMIRGSILMMSPLPDTRRAHGLVLQHERQIDVTAHQHAHAQAFAAGRTPIHKASNGIFNTAGSLRKHQKCTHCDGIGHTIDRCYFLIGFPEGHKWHGKDVKPRNKRPSPAMNNVDSTKQAVLPTAAPNYMFTPEEYSQILTLIQEKHGNCSPQANATGLGYEEDDWPGQAS